jgi:hypothetical protein
LEARLGGGVLYFVRLEFIQDIADRKDIIIIIIIIDGSSVEAGSNTSTVALRLLGGDEKGSLESETVKYGHESHGTRTRK